MRSLSANSPLSLPLLPTHRCAPPPPASGWAAAAALSPLPSAPHRHLPSNLPFFSPPIDAPPPNPTHHPARPARPSSPATESTPHQVDGRLRGTGTPTPPPRLPSPPIPLLDGYQTNEDGSLTPPPATVHAARNRSCSGLVAIDLVAGWDD
jgi:hypothetical protein